MITASGQQTGGIFLFEKGEDYGTDNESGNSL
jgi:hypothetical protein